MTKERILQEIDSATEPDKMGPGEALEYLEGLVSDLESRMEGIKDDMRAKGQDWG